MKSISGFVLNFDKETETLIHSHIKLEAIKDYTKWGKFMDTFIFSASFFGYSFMIINYCIKKKSDTGEDSIQKFRFQRYNDNLDIFN